MTCDNLNPMPSCQQSCCLMLKPVYWFVLLVLCRCRHHITDPFCMKLARSDGDIYKCQKQEVLLRKTSVFISFISSTNEDPHQGHERAFLLSVSTNTKLLHAALLQILNPQGIATCGQHVVMCVCAGTPWGSGVAWGTPARGGLI